MKPETSAVATRTLPVGSGTLPTAIIPMRDVRLVSSHSGMKQG